MADTLIDIITSPDADARRRIIDATDYGRHVLLQDREIPWHDATAYSNHLSQLQSLLGSDVALIRLDRMIADELQHNGELVERMGEKSRKGYAARALLTDEDFKAAVRELVNTAGQTQHKPIVLHIPSPKDVLEAADRAVDPDSSHEFDDDAVEHAAVYYSDLLRSLGGLDVAGLILDERSGAIADEPLQPMLNTIQHYRWDLGRRGSDGVEFSGDTQLPVVAADFFNGNAQAPAGPAVFVEVPADAVPEEVLARLAEL